jgi:meiotically up-regulated gene 157 (Mug157) protein
MSVEKKQEALVQAVEEIAKKEGAYWKDNEKLRRTFENCYVSTAKTTTKFLENGEAYVFTGDISAMWLRDSSAQVVHYLPFMKEYPILKEMVQGLIARQARYIHIDPYANAFNEEANGNCWEKDLTDSCPWDWERKYEIDSLCYPVWLIHQYVEYTGAHDVFTPQVKQAFRDILDVWKREQDHATSNYTFVRPNCWPSDTLSRNGLGEPVGYTGMTWSGFRPSDDACKYGYLIPSNMFAVVVLGYMETFLREEYQDEDMAGEAAQLKAQIEEGIRKYGIAKDDTFGEIYAYETDGLGNYNLMDDANVPSLLSLPWLGYCDTEDPIYQNTRAFVLSKKNPYYYEGKKAKGIGSPHTPNSFIWHIALTMQGLTSHDEAEREELLQTLLSTDADCEVMHEGFHCDDPQKFTRKWFAWANSLFALFALSMKK